jgi:hypothetical protein
MQILGSGRRWGAQHHLGARAMRRGAQTQSRVAVSSSHDAPAKRCKEAIPSWLYYALELLALEQPGPCIVLFYYPGGVFADGPTSILYLFEKSRLKEADRRQTGACWETGITTV